MEATEPEMKTSFGLSKASLFSLPSEVHCQILSNLPKSDMFWNFGFTCQKFFDIACDILKYQLDISPELSKIKDLLLYKEIKDAISYFVVDTSGYTFDESLRKIHEVQEKPSLCVCLKLPDKICHNIAKLEKKDVYELLVQCANLKAIFFNVSAIAQFFHKLQFLHCDSSYSQFHSLPSIDSISKFSLDIILKAISFYRIEHVSIIGCSVTKSLQNKNNLKNLSSLRYLNLSYCKVDCDVIFKICQHCPYLEELVIYGIPNLPMSDKHEQAMLKLPSLKRGLVSPHWLERALKLRDQFCKYGSCKPGMSEKDIVGLIKLDSALHMPESFLALLMAAREWHSIRLDN